LVQNEPKPKSQIKNDRLRRIPLIEQIPERKKKGGKLGNEDFSSELSDAEYDYIAGIYGNVTDFSES
jgi:hypothetical protein